MDTSVIAPAIVAIGLLAQVVHKLVGAKSTDAKIDELHRLHTQTDPETGAPLCRAILTSVKNVEKTLAGDKPR